MSWCEVVILHQLPFSTWLSRVKKWVWDDAELEP
jgi:hypothetical protein